MIQEISYRRYIHKIQAYIQSYKGLSNVASKSKIIGVPSFFQMNVFRTRMLKRHLETGIIMRVRGMKLRLGSSLFFISAALNVKVLSWPSFSGVF